MSLFIRIIFILSCGVLIFNLTESHGQGYHVSTLSQELSFVERFNYVLFGSLPNRIYYSYEKRCYIVRGQTSRYRNDLRRKKGKRYKAIPRWQYYLSKLSPMNLIKSGLEFVSIGKTVLFGGGFSDLNDDDVDGDVDDDAHGGTDGDADDAKDNEKEKGLLSKGMDAGMGLMSPLFNLFGGSKDANNNNNNDKKDDDNDKKDDDNDKKDDNNDKKDDDNDKKDEKKDEEPGLLENGMNMGKGLMSPLFNLFGGSKDTNNNNNNDKKDEKKDDNKEGDPDAGIINNVLESEAMGVVKDVLQSETAKDVVKTGIGFLPGGPAVVAILNAAEKYQKADATVDKLEDKLPKFK